MGGGGEDLTRRRLSVTFPARTERWVQQACIGSLIDPVLLRAGASVAQIEVVSLALMEAIELLDAVGGVRQAELFEHADQISVRLSPEGSPRLPDWDDAASAIVDASMGEFRVEQGRIVFTLALSGDRSRAAGS